LFVVEEASQLWRQFVLQAANPWKGNSQQQDIIQMWSDY